MTNIITRSKIIACAICFCGAFLLSAPSIAQNAPAILPAEAFYSLPSITNLRLSPDATRVAGLKHVGAETAIIIMDLATGETFYPTNNDNKEYKINWIEWANNDRILMSVLFFLSEPELGFKHKVPNTRLLSIEAKKNASMINLVKRKEINKDLAVIRNPARFEDNVWVSAQYPTQIQDNVIGKIEGDSDHILVSVDNKVELHQTVYKVNVNNAKSTIVKREDGSNSWIADRQGVVRLGIDFNPRDTEVSFKVLDPNTQEWTKAWSYFSYKDTPITPLGFGKNPNDLYLIADFNGSPALYKANLSKKGYPWTFVLNSVASKTEGSLLYSETFGEVVGLYNKNGGDNILFLNEDLQRFQTGLNRALPDTLNQIVHINDSGRKYIVKTSTATDPGHYYFGDRDTKLLTPLFDLYPELQKEPFVEKKKVVYRTRDGVELTGFLSKPKNITDKPMATIIIPQGEPVSDNREFFDPFSAFLVNRGYAVFQPGTRSIKEKGMDLLLKVARGNGVLLQNDIEDGIDFLIKEKIADSNKLGILGGSYGGYAALMGATNTPDLFRCVISIAGVSSVEPFVKSMHYNEAPELLSKSLKEIKMESPINNVANIKAPILLIHDEDDQIIPVEQSRMMAVELKHQHKVYQYLELKEGNHELTSFSHRKQTFEAMEAFLKKYLPVE